MSYYSEIFTKVLHIPGVGSKTAQKIVSEIREKPIRDDEDFIEMLLNIKDNFRLSRLTEIDIRDAFHKGEQVLEESSKMGVKMMSIFDNDYPEKLRKFKANPPVLLHFKGDISSIKENPSCAVIGTREPTGNGYNVGVRVGELLAENNVVVVSGLAKGCDTAGHTGCLNKNGKTVAVLAHGLKHLYPKENKKLSETILEKGGALISEYFYDQPARNNFFVERDRIQAGLSDNVFVVETGVKGGTMHTVKYALDNHKKIFTYKHPEKYLHEDKAQGNQMLIKEAKATPVGNSEEFNKFLIYMFESNWDPASGTGGWLQHHLHNNFHFSGSFLLDTEIKPLNKSDLDIDIAIHFKRTDPNSIKNDLKPPGKVNQILKRLEDNKTNSEGKETNNSQLNLWE